MSSFTRQGQQKMLILVLRFAKISEVLAGQCYLREGKHLKSLHQAILAVSCTKIYLFELSPTKFVLQNEPQLEKPQKINGKPQPV